MRSTSLRFVVSLAVGISAAAATIVAIQPTEAAQPALPIRAAFYYPWYPETWGDGTHFHPTLGQYDSSSAAVIKQHVAWMQQAGIQAGIASWWGPGTPTDGRFSALEANAGKTFKWTAYYEREGYSNPSQSQINSDIKYLKSHYVRNHPQWLRVNSKPVLFVYADPTDGCAMANRWVDANRGRFYLNLKVFPGYRDCASQPDSWHQYAPAAREDSQAPYSYSISPGFWRATDATPTLTRDLSAFQQAVTNMTASGAQWQLVTTFNEWGEGSAVEPASEWGQSYLDALAGGSSSPSPSTTTPPPPPTDALVVIYMENHERNEITNSTSAPFLNGFRAKGIDFTHYYGVAHPSLPNYLAFGNGSTDGKTGTDTIAAGELNQSPTLWNQLAAAGIQWRVLQESMPSACYQPSSSPDGLYRLKHNPATPFAAVFDNKPLCANVVPYTSPSQIVDGLNFLTPNMCNDMHDCGIATGDRWLAANVQPMLDAGATVVITWDEGDTSTNGGGNIYTAVVGPGITPRTDTATYNHYSLLAAVEQRYGLSKLGSAQTAAVLPLG